MIIESGTYIGDGLDNKIVTAPNGTGTGIVFIKGGANNMVLSASNMAANAAVGSGLKKIKVGVGL